VITDARAVVVAPVAGIPIVHELSDDIELERRDAVPWEGSEPSRAPLVIRHERGDVGTAGMRRMLDVPPWCTFYVDQCGEPAALFHGIFGEVDRLLVCDRPGTSYTVRYGAAPNEPVVALQSELAAFSFALSARELGLIAHSCAFVTPLGDGVLCPGVSGTGKTTLARLLAAHAPEISLLTDDRAIVTLDDGDLRMTGSPWPGAARIAGSGSAPLRTVVFIAHDRVCTARAVPPAEAFRRIVNTLSMPLWEPARCGRALEIVDAIVSRSELLELGFPPDADGAAWVTQHVHRAQPLGSRGR
jgi:hypothetical protein